MKTLPTKPAPQHFHGKPVAPQHFHGKPVAPQHFHGKPVAPQAETCKPAAPHFHGHPVAPNDKPEAPGTGGKPAPYLRHKPGFGGPIYKGGDVFKADSFKAGAFDKGPGKLEQGGKVAQGGKLEQGSKVAQGGKLEQGGEKLGAELSKLGQAIGAIDKGLGQLEAKVMGPTEGKPALPKGKPGALNEKPGFTSEKDSGKPGKVFGGEQGATPVEEKVPHVAEAFTK